jgi:hypothetical protein
LALTWPKSGGRSVGIVRLLTKATEFVVVDNNNNRNFKNEVSGNILNMEDGKRGFSSNAEVPLTTEHKKS